jgi:tRNA-specific 2-thiouridylase
MKKRVVVAMSGGVDSSLAAFLLKEEGYEVIGATMRIWKEREAGKSLYRCCGVSDVEDARRVAQQLDIPFYVLNLEEAFEREVIQYFCDEYKKGRTPNPCILCNQKIKFGTFLKKALELEGDFLATGHYARLEFDEEKKRYLLRKGTDEKKDQSYVLFSLTQDQFRYALFPLGTSCKADVRRRAFQLGLRVHDKPESQEVCFIEENSYHPFLKERWGDVIKPGPIVDCKGNVLGEHKGIPFYTIGQRRGLRLARGKPLYVIDIDRERNVVVVGAEKEVYGETFVVEGLNWIPFERMDSLFSARVKIRYNHPGSEAVLSPLGEDRVVVKLKSPQKAITPGQAAVFYEGETVLGGGWIKEVIRSAECGLRNAP